MQSSSVICSLWSALLLLKERIGRSFPADGAGRPMSADDCNVVSQWQELVADRLQQLPVIASGKVDAADGTREQHVAHNGQTLVRTEKDDASRRVPGTMQDLECQLPNLDAISVFQPSLGCHVRGVQHAVGKGTFAHPLEQKQ